MPTSRSARRLSAFRAKYRFIPHRELARAYWEAGVRSDSAELSLIAFAHAVRVWPDIIHRPY